MMHNKLAGFGIVLGIMMLCACGAESQQPGAEAGDVSPLPAEAQDVRTAPRQNALPNWELKDVNGNTVRLADYIGKKGVLMVFFATWCPHCMAEVPQLVEFTNKHQGQPVEVIAIAIKQPPQTIQQFIKSRGVNYTVVLDENGAVAQQYGVPGIPLNIGVDGTGAVIHRDHVLPKDMDEFAKQLTTGLPGGGPAPVSR